jgi:hypothetical protein
MSTTLSWLLFILGWLLAGLLACVVLLSPMFDDTSIDMGELSGNERIIALFARDAMVRRTTLASAVGLLVSAWIFFQPSRGRGYDVAEGGSAPPRRPRSRVAGA